MEKIAISLSAQTALMRLLHKMDFIDTTDMPKEFDDFNRCPISYYASRDILNEWQAIAMLAEKLDIETLKLTKDSFSEYKESLDNPELSRISPSRWLKLRVFPLSIDDNELRILVANPLDFETQSMLQFEFSRNIRLIIGREDEIEALLTTKTSPSLIFNLDNILNTPGGDDENISSVMKESEENVAEDNIEAAPVIRLVNYIFSNSVHHGASDIHITPEKNALAVKVRVDGLLQPLMEVPVKYREAVVARIKVLAGMDIAEKRKPQDGRIRIKTGVGRKDLRISSVPSIHGENIVARILSSDLEKVSFEALQFPKDLQEELAVQLRGSSKVILLAGPTGSGKTSTLYGGLQHINDGTRNIITVEDPIEYRINGITQIQVNNRAGMSFAEGLKSILRQDPDIIMVGEIRDKETAQIAMQAAQTGHLVLSTIHTNSAPAAITRLMDLGIPPYLVASSLGAVLAQRLVRTLCPHCYTQASEETLRRCDELGIDSEHVMSANGCDKCNDTGYLGRMGIFSMLNVDPAVSEVIRDTEGEYQIANAAFQSGFKTLKEDALTLVYNQKTSLEEAERVVGSLEEVLGKRGDNFKKETRIIAPELTEELQSEAVKKKPAKKHILLVEDDPDIREILKMYFEGEKYQVSEAEDGYDAFDRIYECVPDIIVCDLMLPKMDGKELVGRLKRDEETAGIPVLMLTAAGTAENEIDLLQTGADDFVDKATNTKVLLARVQSLLARG